MTWIADDEFQHGKPFGPATLPFGVVRVEHEPVTAVRVGEHAVPLPSIADALGPRLAPLVTATSLDPLLAAGAWAWRELYERLRYLVTANSAPPGARLIALAETKTLLPFTVGDYVDFYSSRHHAENVGRILRPDSDPLLPNWSHLPVGYHGRAGTVVVSGTDVVRPNGQRSGRDGPTFGPSRRLDIEAEVAFVCGGPVVTHLSTSQAAHHICGVALLNDWSARDIQAWEYQPLGPFLGKSFATSLGAWITPLCAFGAARVALPVPAQPLLPYLVDDEPWGLDIQLEVRWNGTVVSRPRFADMAYSCTQQLVHMTVNGATVRPGDLFASGTVSGPDVDQRGCFLELTWGGRDPVTLAGGERRTFLEDGDTVVISAQAPGPDADVVGLAEVSGTVLPAVDLPEGPGPW